MKGNGMAITESSYYLTTFNSGIFDGPFRFYFAQFQEPIALKAYLSLQKKLGEQYSSIKTNFQNVQNCIYIFVYPTSESLRQCFEKPSMNKVNIGYHEDSVVIGVSAFFLEDFFDQAIDSISSAIEMFENNALPEAPEEHNHINELTL